VVVLLLLAVEVLHGFEHVQLVETFLFGQTLYLPAKGFGLVQHLEAE
jgi:hypothetical protein